jgi:hypothetical protein
MRVLRAIAATFFGAVTGFVVVALAGAVYFQIWAVKQPNADLRPDSAWLLGAFWIGLGFGGYGALVGAVLGFYRFVRARSKASISE